MSVGMTILFIVGLATYFILDGKRDQAIIDAHRKRMGKS